MDFSFETAIDLTGRCGAVGGPAGLSRPTLPSELNVRIDLPGRPLHVSAKIVERGPPDLAVVSFDRIDSYERARLGEFLRTAG